MGEYQRLLQMLELVSLGVTKNTLQVLDNQFFSDMRSLLDDTSKKVCKRYKMMDGISQQTCVSLIKPFSNMYEHFSKIRIECESECKENQEHLVKLDAIIVELEAILSRQTRNY